MSTNSPLRVGIAGLGTVGCGVVDVLTQNAAVLEMRAGRPIQIVAVSARDKAKDRGVSFEGYDWYDNPADMAAADTVDLVVEAIGGHEGPAKGLVEAALHNGQHVVTANKALMAHHGGALTALAEKNDRTLAYEAAVAGGIPVIKSIREGFAANNLRAVYGILNGTCNYILSRMRDEGLDFEDVLAEAQRLGYAEADPGFDIDGVDAAHKLCLLSALAFGMPVNMDDMTVEGIRHIALSDIRFATDLGYKIKLLGIARRHKGGVEQRVEPCMVPVDAPIASVEGVFNAVVVDGDFVDMGMAVGRGAGAGPTASAVVADIVDIARAIQPPLFGVRSDDMQDLPVMSTDDHLSKFYLRLMVLDKPGVVAAITAVLRDYEVSLEAIVQHGRDPGQQVTVLMTTHEVAEGAMRKARDLIEGLDVVDSAHLIRIETFGA